MKKVTVVTINIFGLVHEWFEKRRQVLFQELEKLNPDVVFLQETTVVPEKVYDQSLDIAQAIGLECVAFAPYGNMNEFQSPRLGGVAILSKWPFKHVQNHKLPPGKKDPFGERVGLIGKIAVEGKEILLGTTHLSWRPEEEKLRLSQTENFLELLKRNGSPLVIFGGDFNTTPESPAIQFVKKSYKDTFAVTHPEEAGFTWSEENTYIRSRTNRRIDFLFCSQELSVTRAEVVLNEALPFFPSDHFGILIEISL